MSEWTCPAACQAVSPRRRCQLCAGLSSPAVKNASRSSRPNAPRTTRSRPVSPIPSSSRIAPASSSSSSDSSASIRDEIATAAAPTATAWSATTDGTASSPSSTFARSEEHTSELQSRQYLVCRLLLEKKKKNTKNMLYSNKKHTKKI